MFPFFYFNFLTLFQLLGVVSRKLTHTLPIIIRRWFEQVTANQTGVTVLVLTLKARSSSYPVSWLSNRFLPDIAKDQLRTWESRGREKKQTMCWLVRLLFFFWSVFFFRLLLIGFFWAPLYSSRISKDRSTNYGKTLSCLAPLQPPHPFPRWFAHLQEHLNKFAIFLMSYNTRYQSAL